MFIGMRQLDVSQIHLVDRDCWMSHYYIDVDGLSMIMQGSMTCDVEKADFSVCFC